jgi:hypothetical protein
VLLLHAALITSGLYHTVLSLHAGSTLQLQHQLSQQLLCLEQSINSIALKVRSLLLPGFQDPYKSILLHPGLVTRLVDASSCLVPAGSADQL